MNLEDIKILREYFLSNSNDIKRSMRNVIPGMFMKYMPVLQDAFLKNGDITQSVKSIDAINLLPEIKKLQIDYYFSLASIYYKGEINPEIDTLIKNNAELFKQVLDDYDNHIFQNEITQAFTLNEREQLKKKFQEIDKADEITSTEMEDAFKLIERDRLKESFRKLDNNEIYETSFTDNLVAEDTTEYLARPKKIIPLNPVLKFNWKKMAVAACIITLISTVTIIIYNKKNSTNELADKDTLNKNKYLINTDSVKNITPPFSVFNIRYDSLQIVVLKNKLLNPGSEKEKINIRTYLVENKINELKSFLDLEFEGKSNKGKSEPKAKITLEAIDSLQSLLNKYFFDGETLSLYRNPKSNPIIYKMDDTFYLKIGADTYLITKLGSPAKLMIITDKFLLDRIDLIKKYYEN